MCNLSQGVEQLGIEKGMARGIARGRKEGRQEGLKEGRQEGRKEGLQEGRQEGLQEGRAEIIRKLLDGGMTVEKVASLLELPQKDVERYRK